MESKIKILSDNRSAGHNYYLSDRIEAGLVLSGLLHAGLVRRCLVVAPSHLTVQWLAELFHKFNLLFTLMDPERAQGDRTDEAENPGTPWSRHKLEPVPPPGPHPRLRLD